MSNYPPGTYAGDARAPWNEEPEIKDYTVYYCRDCKHYYATNASSGVCALYDEDIDALEPACTNLRLKEV